MRWKRSVVFSKERKNEAKRQKKNLKRIREEKSAYCLSLALCYVVPIVWVADGIVSVGKK
jgi:hypothetical protein